MRGIGLLTYGPTGIGKTHWSLLWPGPLLCISMVETGADDLQYIGDVPPSVTLLTADKYSNLIAILDQCMAQPTFKTIVLDSLSGFQQIFFEHLIQCNIPTTKSQTYKQAEQEFWAFYRGPRMEAPNAMVPFTSKLTAILNQGVNIVLIGHKRNASEENVSGADYKRAEIDMDEGIRNCILKWAPNVIYMSMEPNITQVTKSSGYGANASPTQGKTELLGSKLIYTCTNAQNSAKNKLHLPAILPIGASAQETFNTFWTLVPEVYKK
jgi:hypothetical protein